MVYGVEVGHGKSDDDDAASQAGDVADTFLLKEPDRFLKSPMTMQMVNISTPTIKALFISYKKKLFETGDNLLGIKYAFPRLKWLPRFCLW